jgi:hypothetical protein
LPRCLELPAGLEAVQGWIEKALVAGLGGAGGCGVGADRSLAHPAEYVWAGEGIAVECPEDLLSLVG